MKSFIILALGVLLVTGKITLNNELTIVNGTLEAETGTFKKLVVGEECTVGGQLQAESIQAENIEVKEL